MSARGPVPSLAQAIAGAPLRGSWWGHPMSHQMYRVFEGVCDSDQVLVCRLVRGLAAIREEHTARGKHRVRVTPFPRWVPKPVLDQARLLSRADAVAQWSADLLFKVSGRTHAKQGVVT